MQRRDPAGVETAVIAERVELGGQRVLDVGCGRGRLTAFAAARAAHVYAFDPAAENVAQASAALAQNATQCGSRSTMLKRSTSSGDGSTSRSAAGRCDASRSRAS